jgi:hypothetical protein
VNKQVIAVSNTRKGKIPTAPFLACVEPLLPLPDQDWYTRLRSLAAACNVKVDSLYKALLRCNELDFDLCDLILCKLNAVHLWWTEPLDEFYWNVTL